jgi:hypothetical protein
MLSTAAKSRKWQLHAHWHTSQMYHVVGTAAVRPCVLTLCAVYQLQL